MNTTLALRDEPSAVQRDLVRSMGQRQEIAEILQARAIEEIVRCGKTVESLILKVYGLIHIQESKLSDLK